MLCPLMRLFHHTLAENPRETTRGSRLHPLIIKTRFQPHFPYHELEFTLFRTALMTADNCLRETLIVNYRYRFRAKHRFMGSSHPHPTAKTPFGNEQKFTVAVRLLRHNIDIIVGCHHGRADLLPLSRPGFALHLDIGAHSFVPFHTFIFYIRSNLKSA